MFASPVAGLTAELFWLTAATVLTGLLWLPYILNRIAEHGLWRAMQNPGPDQAPRAQWAIRLRAAHTNAVENLVVFAPLVLVAVAAQRTGPLTAAAAAVYVFARLAHAVIYTAGVPVARTLAFGASWAACFFLVLAILGLA